MCRRPRRLDSSGAAEADGDRVVVDNHRHRAAPLAELEHPRQVGGILLHVDVFERDVPPLVVVTGGLRVRSRVFAEDVDHTQL